MTLTHLTTLIMKHTLVSRSHLTPELALRLITPSCSLWSLPEEESPFKDPFWAFYWPGGQATARFILDNPNKFADRRILDIGCGCGAGSIAAAKVNAKLVIANDIDPYAVLASTINSNLNEVHIETSTNNFIGSKCEHFDTILVGDMFYDEEFANLLFKWLLKLRENGKTILIGDPGRHGLTDKRKKLINQVAKYALPEESCVENHGFTETVLWEVK